MKSSRPLVYLAVAAAVLALGMLVVGTGEKKSAAPPPEHPPLAVSALPVQRETLRHWVYGEGKAYAIRREYLFFEKAGKVVHLGTDKEGRPLREGSIVSGPGEGETLGQLLARIDTRDDLETYTSQEAYQRKSAEGISSAQADIAQAQTDLQLARLDLERSRALLKQDAIAAQELESKQAVFENARAKLRSAEARLRTAQAEYAATTADLRKAKLGLERTGLFAPFTGMVAYLNIRMGDSVAPEAVDRSSAERMSKTTPVVLIDPSQYEVVVDLPPFAAHGVQEGQQAYFFFGQTMLSPERLLQIPPEQRPPHATGKVYSITPSISEDSRTVQVKLHTVQGAEHLKDGMLVTAWVADEQRDDALVISMESLVFSDGRPSVFVFEPESGSASAATGKAVQRQMRMGISGITNVEVLEGVREGELVITEGRHLLVNGTAVQVVPVEGR